MDAYTVIPSPKGRIHLLVSPRGLKHCTLPGHPPEERGPCVAPTDPHIKPYSDWIQAYFSGEYLPLPPLDPQGTPFQRAVWQQVTTIPPGHAKSYQAVAVAAGYPRASRAVGSAMARNPIPLFVPCHRVIRADGDVGSFGGGRILKIWLLNHEKYYENR